jgi:hypothetical protein
MMKDSPSFKAALEKASAAANVFQDSDSGRIFNKGMERLGDRQALGEGVLDVLKPQFTKLVGKCPQCSVDIGAARKFCPECGASLA